MINVKQLFDLSGQVALVTGGYTGLGWQISKTLAELGASVAMCARDGAKSAEAAQRLHEQAGVETFSQACDISKADQVDSLVDNVIKRFGKIDVLVNNAGITWGSPLEDMPETRWKQVLDVNLTGVFLCTQRVGREMLKRHKGKIINISSVSALRGLPFMEASGYIATKGGIISFTRHLASRWAPEGIYVNAIAPGFFSSDMADSFMRMEGKKEAVIREIPVGRTGSDHDLKGSVAFLASAASDYVCGAVIVVDGGMSAC